MNNQTTSSMLDGEVFYSTLIADYVDAPRFVPRSWLAERVQSALGNAGCRFLLLTAEPGAGKTAFMAWLARQHPDWPRYFIRRDQRTPLGDVGARSLLLQIGLQLAATYPQLFSKEQITVAVEQRIGMLAETGQAVGAKVERIVASPFHQAVVQIQQQVEESKGNLIGIRIGEWITDPRLISVEDLQYMALLDPALAMLKTHPDEQIVVLVDALDELRYHFSQYSLLTWLATCPNLPSNLRFVLTSRPDEALLARFRGAQQPWLQELEITTDNPNPDYRQQLRADVHHYAQKLVGQPSVKATLGSAKATENFVDQAVEKAQGNIGYLDAVGRAIDQALEREDQQLLSQLVDLSNLPSTLAGLYVSFLHQLKDVVSRKSIEVEDPETGEVHYLSAWPAVYQRILGVLTVAREPLNLRQIRRLGGIIAGEEYLIEAKEYLRQFLAQEGDGYLLYHATLVEILTAESTRQNPESQNIYQDAARWHRRVVASYRDGSVAWEEVPWSQVDSYGLRYLAYHLYEAGYKEELYALLTGSPEWMNRKNGVLTSDAPYLADLDLAISDFCDPLTNTGALLTLVQLHAARQVVNARVSGYTVTDLQALVWLNRESEALANATLHSETRKRFDSLLAIYRVLQKKGQANPSLVNELQVSANAIRDDEYRMEALSSLATTLALAGRYEEAREVAGAIRTYTSWHVEALASVAAAMARTGDELEANAVLGEVRSMPFRMGDDIHRSWALSSLVTASVQLNHFEWARQEAYAIVDEEPRSKALASLATALARAGRYEEAREVAGAIKDKRGRSEAFASLATVLAQAGRFDEARGVAYATADERHRSEALTSVAAALIQAGDEQGANALFGEAREVAGAIKDKRHRSKALASVAAALIQAGDEQGANALFGEARAVAGAIRDEEYSMSLVSQVKPRSEALASVAIVMAQAGDEQGANALFGEARAAAYAMEDTWYRSEALASIVITLTQAGRFDEARGVAYAISKDEERRSKALASVATALSRAGDERGASALFGEAREAAYAIEGSRSYWLRFDALSSLVAALAQAGRFDEAREVASPIVDGGEFLEEDYASKAKASLATALAQAGRFDEAREVADSIYIYKSWQKVALSSLATALAQAGRFDEAREVADSVLDEERRSQALSSLATALAQARRYVEAFASLGLRELDMFLQVITGWTASMEQLESGLSVDVLREATSIAGWTSADWLEIHNLLARLRQSN